MGGLGGRPAEARIDLDAIAHNLSETRRLAPGCGVIAVVKADAYGHGAVAVARRLVQEGCHALAVLSVAEASPLRAVAPELPILVLGGVHDAAEADRAAELRLVPVVHHEDDLALLAEAGRRLGAPVAIELEVDTGMRRMGIAAERACGLLARAASEPALSTAGVFTHLACADDPDPGGSREQLTRFSAMVAQARSDGLVPRRVHVANSAGILQAPELARQLPPEVNAVRPGLLLYGVVPAEHQRERVSLRPAMSFRTRVAAVREVLRGDAVGYGATFRASGPGQIATAAAGYADGVPWSLGGRGEALVAGCPAPYAGRVSMDYVTLDTSRRPAGVGDEVVIFGRSGEGGASLPVEDVAARAGTIAYELLVGVGQRVPRVTG